MSRRFVALMKKDFVLGFKNAFTAVVFISALVIILIYHFIIPKDLSPKLNIYVALDADVKATVMKQLSQIPEDHLLETRDDLLEKVRSDLTAIGLFYTSSNKGLEAQLIYHGYESKSQIALYKLALEKAYLNTTMPITYHTERLADESQDPIIPFNELLIPLFLVFESSLIGLVLVAALLLDEKEQGTHLVYAITPGPIWQYLLSKIVFMLFLGLLSGGLLTLFTLGFKANLGLVLLIVGLGNVLGTLLGLLIAAFFDSLQKSMIWIVAICIPMGLPGISYFMPSFSPAWMKINPIYPMMFALKDLLFGKTLTSLVTQTILYFVLLNLGLFGLTTWVYKKRLVKG